LRLLLRKLSRCGAEKTIRARPDRQHGAAAFDVEQFYTFNFRQRLAALVIFSASDTGTYTVAVVLGGMVVSNSNFPFFNRHSLAMRPRIES